MSEKNKQLAIRFIEAFARGDADETAACLSRDAVVLSKGFGKLSGMRSFEFIVGTAAAFKDVMPNGLNPRFLMTIAEGDKVMVEFEGNAVLSNGQPYDNQYCFVFVIADDKIIEAHEYYCTLLADRQVGPLLADIESRRHAATGA